MNKYFIGYPIPECAKQIIRELRLQIHQPGEMVGDDHLHVTALYLGAVTSDQANAVMDGLNRTISGQLPPDVQFSGFARMGGCLAMTLVDMRPKQMERIKEILSEVAYKSGITLSSLYPGYTPHVTITKSRKAFCMAKISELIFPLPTICLYEKPEGGEYHQARIMRFYGSE